MGVRDDAEAIAPELVGLRRAIHREPEIGLDLPGTQGKVLAALDGLPLEISLGTALSSVTAVLRGEGAAPGGGPVVLLRGDMDALPVTERTGLDYASQIDGVMHACGHDLHTAMLAGAARLLAARRRELPGTVVFMFQPGEEGHAGARHMISEGVLDAAGQRPVAAYALHVASADWPAGVCSTRPGPMLAAAEILAVTVHGHGGHGSEPHHAADPIPAACEMVTALQTLVTRRFDVFDPIVITVGSFHAGTTDNVIPDDATFLATVRSFSPEARDRVRESALALVGGIAAAHGLTVERRVPRRLPGDGQRRGGDAVRGGGRGGPARRGALPGPAQPDDRRGGLLLRAGAGAGRVPHAGGVPAGRGPGHRAQQPRRRRRLRRLGAGRRRRALRRTSPPAPTRRRRVHSLPPPEPGPASGSDCRPDGGRRSERRWMSTSSAPWAAVR